MNAKELAREADRLRIKIKTLQDDIERTKRSAESHAASGNDVNAKVDQDHIEAATRELEQLEQETASHEAEAARKIQEAEKLRRDKDALKSEMDNRMKDLDKRIEDLEGGSIGLF